ncbi:hypothetical protein [Luteolibacter sp. LG18]|uniref:hypothetical protein n=1 Tax=Luteolibacter sp. LG18 TaxID=2819286 RepID=UPI002B290203|nr:hypothetical protein llg_13500 [Luteolibacter sp. LG18]
MRPLSVVVALLACSCTRDHPVEKAIGYGGAVLCLVAAVVLGIMAECQPQPELRERYDRFCGMLLLAALCGVLAA